MQEVPSPVRIEQTAMAFQRAKVLLSAIELGLFTELAKGPANSHTLRSRLGIHPRAGSDFFDALVAIGLLRREDGIYSNTEETAFYLDRSRPSYLRLGGFLEIANTRIYKYWGNLTQTLVSGEPYGEPYADTSPHYTDDLYATAGKTKQFLSAMTALSHAGNSRIAAQFPWKEYSSFADLGTGQGDLAVQVAQSNQHLTGIGFDLPEAEHVFLDFVQENCLADRLSFIPGNFLTDSFPNVDVILFGHILHNWGMEKRMLLLRKAYEALSPGGAVLIHDAVLDEARTTNVFGLLMSLNMLVATPEGSGYTGSECMGWLRDSGFSDPRVEQLTDSHFMVIGTK